MAKANWITTNPSQGSGNVTVNVSSTAEHTGRTARTTTLTWKAANVEDVVRTVNQAGKPEFVDIADTASAAKTGQTVTITGVSNSKKLTFSLGIGDLLVVIYRDEYTAAGVSSILNGDEIPGDPGANAKYDFSIRVDVPANNTTEPLSRQIIVTDEGGNQDVCTLTSAAGDAYLTVQEGTIELDYLGTPVAVTVESNTNWTIE